jgi:hypothetical protein
VAGVRSARNITAPPAANPAANQNNERAPEPFDAGTGVGSAGCNFSQSAITSRASAARGRIDAHLHGIAQRDLASRALQEFAVHARGDPGL